MNWTATAESKPTLKGRIAIWFDDDIFSARVLENGIVNCPVLELTWDLNEDPVTELFSHWMAVEDPTGLT